MSAPPKKPGLSLYADLLESDKQKPQGVTISGAPVKYDVRKDADDDAHKKKDASLKFQPIKRPHAQQKSTKPKVPLSSSSFHKFSSSTVTASASSPEKQLSSSTPQQLPSVQRSNFEDWVGDEDDDYYYQDRQRGNKKKKKKNKGQEVRSWDWDDIYDPTLPNNYADYKGSEEQHREIRDWKARLYYHQLKEARKGKNGAASSDEEEKPRPMNSMFAPPPNLNFAPPSFDDEPHSRPVNDDEDEYYPRQDSNMRDTPPKFAPSSVPDDPTGEDAYMRRMRLSGMVPDQASPAPPVAAPTPPPLAKKPDVDLDAKRAEAQAKIAAFKAKLQKPPTKSDVSPAIKPTVPPQQSASPAAAAAAAAEEKSPPPPPPPAEEPGTIISRAPVRYELPPPRSDLPASEDAAMADGDDEQDTTSEAEQTRSNRPGQKGFAKRLLKKYGWEQGQGLGAKGEGITTALVGKADKRKKLADAQGGGWAQPANMGKIVGGKRRKVADADQEGDARFGNMSEVIKLEDMLTGLDVQKEIEENNLMQQIGDEMGKKYGNIERLFIWREEMGGKNEVFVKFNSQLSALRAVNATDGMSFAGNSVVARFWDSEMFEKGQYA